MLALDELDGTLGSFDTLVFLGQNFGMLGSRARGAALLRRLTAVTTARGRIVAETFDPHRLDEPVHRRYRERNRRRGRMPGQLRVRVRYHDLSTRWLDWLQVSPEELEDSSPGPAGGSRGRSATDRATSRSWSGTRLTEVRPQVIIRT